VKKKGKMIALTAVLILTIGFSSTTCNTGNTPDYSDGFDGTVKILIKSSKPSPANIVFLGDGFIVEDNVDGGFFDSKVAELYNYIFSIQPFAEYQEYFSVYKIYADSVNREAKKNPGDSTPNTAFNSTYNYLGIDRLLVAQNTSKVSKYANLATPNPHIIIIIVNDVKYGGSGGEIVVTSINERAKEIVIHELGHLFMLADEYVDEEYRQAAGITLAHASTQPNVDVTNNLSEIKWKHFIGLSGYYDTAWEGGYYFASGVWRPTEHSVMESFTVMEFNAISRETITKMIIHNAGETYSLEDFLNRDIPPSGLRRATNNGSENPMPVQPEIYAKLLYGDQKIRARFNGEHD